MCVPLFNNSEGNPPSSVQQRKAKGEGILFNESLPCVEDNTGNEVCDEAEACLETEDYESEGNRPVVPEAESRDDWDVNHRQILIWWGELRVYARES